MKKVLFVATVVQKHINVFHIPYLKMFQEEGYKTYVAAANDTDDQNVKIQYCDEYVEIEFKRNPLHPKNFSAYRKLRKLIQNNDFDIIHCHTPVGGLLGRLAARNARKKGTRVFYTAHGFHFYKGAPLKNWLFFYPVEKFCSYFTDVLITINQEDYALAHKKMKAKRVEYVPGVGIDLSRFKNVQVDRAAKRREIGVPEDAFLLFSVGELNANKNHQVIIKALAKLNNPSVHYAIAGIGDKREYLLNLAAELGIAEQVHLLGYRKDIPELNCSADVFCFPSFREGLSVSLIEVMACGLPVVCSRIRGNTDLITSDGGCLFDPYDVMDCWHAITSIRDGDMSRMSEVNIENSLCYSTNKIITEMKNIYEL
ncbi:MAG: glycosyltransferase family 4 protein [Clostridia bacterium]|nr:glycosyltransferase family 4 protein [Clostridia bacterium]